MLENMDNCEKVEIIQTYLHSPDQNQQIRLRQRGINGHYVYFQTIKKDITAMKRIEIENRLTKDEYLKLANDLRNSDSPSVLHKTEKEDGDTVYFDTDTGYFLVLSTDGYIRTYFNPSGGKKYFDRQ